MGGRASGRVPWLVGLALALLTGPSAPAWGQSAASPGTLFYTVFPCRAADTRESLEGPLLPGAVRYFAFDGCGVPLSAFAVVLNVTVVNTVGNVEVTAFPGDLSPGLTTVVAGSYATPTRAAQAVLRLATDGSGTLGVLGQFAGFAGQADLLLDVTGYFELEDPGSTEDPGGTDTQTTLGLPDEPYDGDPAVLDDPDDYPPEAIGAGPSFGYLPATGPMDCSTYAGGTVTPIGVWGNSPRYLAYSGKIQLLVGASADAACHFMPPTPNTTMADKCHFGNYETVLNDLKAVAVDGNGNPVLNKIRLWVALGWERNRANLPFLWDDARGKWQLDQPNDDYFNRLRAVVSKAKELGFFVEVTFFAPFQGPGFSGSPWSWTSNLAEAPAGSRVGFSSPYYFVINDPRTGQEADRNRRMKDFQKNVVKWTIDKLWCYDNVTWEVANEPENQRVLPLQVAQWQSDMIDWVLKNDCKKSSATDSTCLTPYGQRTALARRHLIAVQPFTRDGGDTFIGDSRVAVLNGHYTQVLTNRGATIPNPPGTPSQLNLGTLQMARAYSTRPKVLGFNEGKITPLGGAGGTRSHLNGTLQQGTADAARAEAWEFILDRGGILDHWGYLPHDAGSSTAVHDIREQLVRLKRFMSGVPLAQLKSSTNPPAWVTGGSLNTYPAGIVPWDESRKSQRFWAADQTDENATTGRLFLLYIHHSTRRCSEVGSPPAERDFVSTGCPPVPGTAVPGPYLAFGGYDARAWTAASSLLYRDSFTVNLGPNPGTFDVYWRNPALSPALDQPPTVIKQQAIAWRQSSCSLANCVVCANPSQTPCTIGLTSSEGYNFDVLLQIAQRP